MTGTQEDGGRKGLAVAFASKIQTRQETYMLAFLLMD